MLTMRELATLRAALLFWKEEMGPHGKQVMQPYFEGLSVETLSNLEVEQLRSQFQPALVRYAQLDNDKQQLVNGQLLVHAADALDAWGTKTHVATVLLPHA